MAVSVIAFSDDGTKALVLCEPCMFCNLTAQTEVDTEGLTRWRNGEFIQSVWPEKTNDERELLMTGTHPGCWDAAFKED